MPVLELDSILLNYDSRVILSNVAIRCNTGEVIGILGRNGSGKSSLLQVVFGSKKAQYRSVRINGDVKEDQITYLPQDNLIPNYIRISRALSLYKIDQDDIVSEFPESKDWLTLYPQQLSGGSRRIIEVLLVLKSRAPFCLLDEPFTGIAPIYIDKLKLIIKNTHTKGVIITDHLYRDVMSIADRLYVLTNGQTYPVKNEHDLKHRGYIF
ncbi:MAG TPA: ATP-binding cassette domain-containing protein [Cyclobacteriaceae bacterium]|nr:ATP-binding cassette domain-containing protein [Cyclobacteriaceae bacterium]